MEESKRYKIKKGINGEIIKLTLVKIRQYPKFGLYEIRRVKESEEGEEDKEIPLYREALTPEQVEDFYKSSTCEEIKV